MRPTESETTYFLKDRTTFIRYYFDEAAKPFVDIHERIDAGTSPFEPYGDPEDGEPLYQAEWEDAEIAIALIGQTCVSLLADSLKLYLNTWRQREFRFAFDKHEDKLAAREGFAAYRAAFSEIFGARWSQWPSASISSTRSCWRVIAASTATACSPCARGMIARRSTSTPCRSSPAPRRSRPGFRATISLGPIWPRPCGSPVKRFGRPLARSRLGLSGSTPMSSTLGPGPRSAWRVVQNRRSEPHSMG